MQALKSIEPEIGSLVERVRLRPPSPVHTGSRRWRHLQLTYTEIQAEGETEWPGTPYRVGSLSPPGLRSAALRRSG